MTAADGSCRHLPSLTAGHGRCRPAVTLRRQSTAAAVNLPSIWNLNLL